MRSTGRRGESPSPAGAEVDAEAVPPYEHEAVMVPGGPQERAAGPAPPTLPDADTLADLVNDVLAKQARRHGVDLS